MTNSNDCFIYPGESPVSFNLNFHYKIISSICGALSVIIPIVDLPFLSAIFHYKDLQTKSNILLAMLAVPDLLKGLFTLPIAAYIMNQLSRGVPPKHVCVQEQMTGVSAVLFVCWSNTVICAIAADVSLSIRRPFFYERKVTKKALVIFILLGWLFFFVLVVTLGSKLDVLKFFHGHGVNIFVILLLKDVLVTIFLYVVYRLVHKEIRRMSSRARRSTCTKESIRVKKAEQKTIVTMFLVLGTLFVCYFPYTICWSIWQSDETFKRREDAYVIIHYVEVATFIKPLFNAFLYYYRLKAVRECCLKRFKYLYSKAVHPQIDTPTTDPGQI